jgi:uncharacterized membrane protein YdjX (TVP38/TMEM64 family)
VKVKTGAILIFIICLLLTAIALVFVGGIDPVKLQHWLSQAGIWAPIVYIIVYIVATLLLIPSTALNLTGGALFGPWLGAFWTSLAAILAAIVAFVFTRSVGRETVAKRLAGRWHAMDAEVKQGGLFYMFAIRLLPLMPYGIVNFAAGLTSVTFKDYVLGTTLGTLPGVLPFVLLGSSGLNAIKTGDVLPLLTALGMTGILVGGSTWYRRNRSFPKAAVEKVKDSEYSKYD